MKAIGYLRVSTEKQAEHGVSLEAQEKKIRAMAEVMGCTDLFLFQDEVSGKSLERKGLAALLEMVKSKQATTIIIAKLDRLTRSVKDLAELLEIFEKNNVALVSVNESLDTHSAAGRLVMNVMASVSQWEREVIGERTRDALAVKKANGECVGTVPYGYERIGDKLIIHHGEQAKIEAARAWRKSGCSYREVAENMNICGYRTRSGSEWRKEYVKNILTPQ